MRSQSITVWTNVDPSSGEGTAHTFSADSAAKLPQTPSLESGLAGRRYSPDFGAAVVVYPGVDDSPTVVGWVTESGTVVRVSDMVVDDDQFSTPPSVDSPQFDALGNFYFQVDDTVYKTKYTGASRPAKPRKLPSRAYNLLVWADGRIGESQGYIFIPSPTNPERGVWRVGGRKFMGFVKNGFIGECDNRICRYPLDSAKSQPWDVGAHPPKGTPLSKASRLPIQGGALDPTGKKLAFYAGKTPVDANGATVFTMTMGGSPAPMDGATGRVLAWLP